MTSISISPGRAAPGAQASLAALAAALFFIAPAMAAPSEIPAEAPEPGGAIPLEDIIVTARRRAEGAQDVPIALSALSAERIATSGAYTLGQMQQLVPSLQVFSFNPRNTNILVRGLGSNVALTNDGLENGVGFYIDGVYYGRVGQSQFDLVDLQQLEVLRGPQGTLFGKNTTAGAINITTRAPSFTPEGSAELSIGNYGYSQVRASVSAPIITDRLAFRLSVSDTSREGFLTNRFDNSRAQNSDSFSVRGQLLAKPTDSLSIRVIGDYANQKQHFVLNMLAGAFTRYADGTPIPNSFVDRVNRAGYAPPPIDPFRRVGDSDAHFQSNMKGYGVSGQVDWELPGATITSISAYRWWDWNPANDGDSTALPVLTRAQQANRQRQFSQEVRIASSGDRRIDYLLGGYYFWQVVKGYGATGYGAAAANWFLPTVPAAIGNAALSGFETNSYSEPETKSLAAFGQLSWHATDTLTFTAGLRYTHEKKSGVFRQFLVSGADLSLLPPAAAAAAQGIRNQFAPITAFDTELTDNSVSALVNLAWKPVDGLLLYGTYQRGQKSGGLNLTVLPAGVNPEVKPEKVDAFEIGLKSGLFGNRATFNLAGYWTDVKDYQTAITDQAAESVVYRQYIANIPKVRSRGFEADLTVSATDFLSANASVAYNDATYRDYSNAPQAPELLNRGSVTDLSGQQLAGAPKWTWQLGADAHHALTELGGRSIEGYAHADWSHRSTYNTSVSNSLYTQVPGYGILNGRIGFRTADGLFDISAWARNLTNKNYFQTLSAANTGLVTAIIGEPRTYGLTFRTRF